MARAVHWCFTLHAKPEQVDAWTNATEAPLQIFDESKMVYLVYQVERASTGQIHIQGFVSLVKKLSLAGVKKVIGDATVHVEKAHGRPDQAAAYCKKADSRVAGPWEWGVEPDARGKKSATALAIEAVQAGKPLCEVAVENPVAWVRSHRGLTSLAAALSKPKDVWRPVTTTVLWGQTRVGKTRRAMESTCVDGRHPYQMPLSSGFWFDGYDGEDTLVIDDFYGQIKFSDMLRILDGHYVQVPIKGGFTWAKWTKVFITSNSHPDEWWKGSRDQIPAASMEAMYNRFTEIINMTSDL